MRRYKKHISAYEFIAAGVLGAVLLTAIVAQLAYDSDLSLLLWVVTGIVILYAFLLLTPLSYVFEENDLVIVNPKPLKDKRIRYADIIEYDAMGSFVLAKKDMDSVEIIVSYTTGRKGRWKTVSCHPKNVTEFVKTLQENCPNLQLSEETKT